MCCLEQTIDKNDCREREKAKKKKLKNPSRKPLGYTNCKKGHSVFLYMGICGI